VASDIMDSMTGIARTSLAELRLPRKAIPREAVVIAVRVLEFLVVVASGLATTAIFEYRVGELFDWYLNTTMLGAIASAVMLECVGAYDDDALHRTSRSFNRVLFGWTCAATGLLVIGFAFKVSVVEYSRLWGGTWFVATAAALLGTRTVVVDQLKRWRSRGTFDIRVVIYGAGSQGQRLAEFITASERLTMRLIGFVDDRTTRLAPGSNRLPVIGGLSDLERLIRRDLVDQVILALPWHAEERIQKIVSRIALTPVSVRLASDLVGYRYTHRSFRMLDGLPVLELFERPISGLSQVIKRIEDQVLGLVAVLVLAPVFAAIAIAIRLDSSGPIFFRQDRVGFNNRTIRIWKFRTMHSDLAEHENIRQVRKGDPRVTRVGRFLRKTSLDELPQLFNVLAGEMSLVGPRPHAPSTTAAGRRFDQVIDNYAARHRVKPGITGWAQVSGWRGETNTEEKLVRRIEHDLYYIENWSVLFDVYILLRTVYTVFRAQNAY
jgi:Undecaprenyl-phosphate glucose phosphotransferase